MTGKTNASIEAPEDRHSSVPHTDLAAVLLLMLALSTAKPAAAKSQICIACTRDVRDLSRAVLSRFSFRPPPILA
jgi:hypothetical protein